MTGRDNTPTPAAAQVPGDQWADVRALLAEGHKIEAIERLRERTGCGLAEAKTLVEAMQAGMPSVPVDRRIVRAALGWLGFILAALLFYLLIGSGFRA